MLHYSKSTGEDWQDFLANLGILADNKTSRRDVFISWTIALKYENLLLGSWKISFSNWKVFGIPPAMKLFINYEIIDEWSSIYNICYARRSKRGI